MSKLLACLFLTLFLGSCAKDPVIPLRIVGGVWPGYEPLYLGRDLEIFSKDKYKITELPSSNITYESFNNGSADIAGLTLDEAIRLVSEGRKLKVLAIMDISNGADTLVVNPKIKTLSDLKGKRIAMINIPLGVYMLNRILDKAKLKATDVTIIFAPEDKHQMLYDEKSVDAFITFEPITSQLTQRGGVVLFSSKEIPNEIFDVIVAHDEIYQTRKKDICDFGKDWFRTLDYIKDNFDTASEKIGKRLGTSSLGYKNMMSGLIVPNLDDHQNLMATSSPKILEVTKRMSDIMLREKLIKSAVNPSEMFDFNYLSCLK